MKAHKHAEVIKAWADGETIEVFSNDDQKWVVIHSPFYWTPEHQYRVKPAEPERAKVETLMSANELTQVWHRADGGTADMLSEVANAALAHAIEAGQVVPMAEVQATAQGLYDQQREARDMAVARAVHQAAISAASYGGPFQLPGLSLESIIAKV